MEILRIPYGPEHLNSVDLDDLEQTEMAHEFEVDLHSMVVANYIAMLEGIDREEEGVLVDIQDGFGLVGRETVDSTLGYVQNGYEDRRRNARLSAVVNLVIRLEQWIFRFTRRLNLKPKHVHQSQLANHVEALNSFLGDGPAPATFFENLAELRHSIVHADSRAEWKYGRNRAVADEFRGTFGDVDLTDEQLKDAINKAIHQVKWYDEKIRAK
jgi:hypothetical protein